MVNMKNIGIALLVIVGLIGLYFLYQYYPDIATSIFVGIVVIIALILWKQTKLSTKWVIIIAATSVVAIIFILFFGAIRTSLIVFFIVIDLALWIFLASAVCNCESIEANLNIKYKAARKKWEQEKKDDLKKREKDRMTEKEKAKNEDEVDDINDKRKLQYHKCQELIFLRWFFCCSVIPLICLFIALTIGPSSVNTLKDYYSFSMDYVRKVDVKFVKEITQSWTENQKAGLWQKLSGNITPATWATIKDVVKVNLAHDIFQKNQGKYGKDLILVFENEGALPGGWTQKKNAAWPNPKAITPTTLTNPGVTTRSKNLLWHISTWVVPIWFVLNFLASIIFLIWSAVCRALLAGKEVADTLKLLTSRDKSPDGSSGSFWKDYIKQEILNQIAGQVKKKSKKGGQP